MDLRLSPVTSPYTSPLGGAGGARPASGAGRPVVAPPQEEAGFSSALKGALKSVSAAQNTSATAAREVQLDNPQVSLEETMVAIQKAQIGFQATLHVRNRMVQAYTDIMNMQV